MASFEFRLPDIGEGLADVELVRWLVAEGDRVEENQPVAEVETDKAIVTMPAPASGRLSRLCVAEGERIKIGSVLLEMDLSEGATPTTLRTPAAAAEPYKEGGTPPAPQQCSTAPAGVQASPAVRRLATKLGVHLEGITGTGPHGRITEDDLLRAAGRTRSTTAEPLRSPALAAPDAVRNFIETVPYRGLRRRIAEAMEHAARTIPHVTGFHEFDASALVRVRTTLKPEAEREGVRLTYLPFIIKAAVLGLRRHPILNASLDEQAGVIQLKRFYNIGIATATPDGLLVPVVRNADQLDLLSLAREVERLATAGREGRLTPGDQQHGTFTVTNVGAARGWLNTSLIRHPEVAILGVGRVEERPVVRRGQIVVGLVMPLALTFDHRVVDGDTGLRFMLTLRRYLEQPELLLVGEPSWNQQ
jgi:pyruvate dehydrogenase E2 component (dihydrolipoamide acetyltransferase)